VVSTALERGHEVVALVRRPGTLTPQERLIEVPWPDVADAETLARALPGADVVISTLGGADKGPTTVCTDGIRSAVTAMKTAGVTRLIVVSAHGALETHDKSLYSRAVWANVAERIRDKETMEHLMPGTRPAPTLCAPASDRRQRTSSMSSPGTCPGARMS
jgi:putative NADH-flavin reductase